VARLAVAVLLLCAGCRFRVGALPGAGGGDDLAVADVDLGTGDDLAAGDDLATTPDLTNDPCANAPALGSGNVAAQCVIGNAPTIDGDLGDWPTSIFQPLTHSTPGVTTIMGTWSGTPATDDANLSAHWAARWDLANLYIAVSVVDDTRETPNTVLTQNDCIELFLDGKHDRTTTYGADDWQLAYAANAAVGIYKDGTAAALPTGATVQKA
jgi:hypothetical protein